MKNQEFVTNVTVEDVQDTDYVLELTCEVDPENGDVLKVKTVTFVSGTDWRWNGDRGIDLKFDPEFYSLADERKFGEWLWNAQKDGADWDDNPNRLRKWQREVAERDVTAAWLEEQEIYA